VRCVRRSTQGKCQEKHVISRSNTWHTSLLLRVRETCSGLAGVDVRIRRLQSLLRSCMDFIRRDENLDIRRVHVDHHESLETQAMK